jgi:protoporphyrinogen/coproporphyrinogen III oxidase
MEEKAQDVIIVGAGLTGLSLALFLREAGFDVLVIEEQQAAGGVIRTHSENGFLFESGPNTGVLGNAEIVQLFDLLSDDCRLLTANADAKHRWIWKSGRWNALPEGLFSAVSTPLFTCGDKFRILREPWVSKGTDPNESLASMVVRRMGKSYLDYAVDPFISGVYAGNPHALVTRFALPKLYQLEQEYGSFIRGAIKKRKIPKSDDEKKVTREVFSVEGGLSNLITALVNHIGSTIIYTGCSNITIKPREEGYETTYINTEGLTCTLHSAHVVTTTGANSLPRLLPFLSPETLLALTNVQYAKVVQVVAGYKHWKGIPLNAFGGLIPSRENSNVLGILFPSSIFAGRAPENGALLSVFMGGMRNPALIDMKDSEITALALETINTGMKLSDATPDLMKIFRYPLAIPQYEKSTEERLAAIEMVQQQHRGLIVGGNLRDGIGMADRVKQATNIARQLINQKQGIV